MRAAFGRFAPRGLTPVGLAAWLLLVVPASARAQDDDEDARAQAHQLLLRSREHYNAGRFVTAADILDEAYAIYPEPTLLFNAARAYEGAGRLDEAIARYERYLAEATDIEDRGAIERRLTTLREQRDRMNEEPDPPAPEEEEEPAEGRSLDPAPWIVGGIGALALAAGGVLGLVATDAYGQAQNATTHRDGTDLERQANDLALGANIVFIVGGAVLLAGVIWLIIDLAGSGSRSDAARRPGVVVF
ncbi:MAG: tetratricopeptide repeat protein [Sandaracinaceae bacterium]